MLHYNDPEARSQKTVLAAIAVATIVIVGAVLYTRPAAQPTQPDHLAQFNDSPLALIEDFTDEDNSPLALIEDFTDEDSSTMSLLDLEDDLVEKWSDIDPSELIGDDVEDMYDEEEMDYFLTNMVCKNSVMQTVCKTGEQALALSRRVGKKCRKKYCCKKVIKTCCPKLYKAAKCKRRKRKRKRLEEEE